MKVMTFEEQISRAFEAGAKAYVDRNRAYAPSAWPPLHWPADAQQKFRDGYAWQEQAWRGKWQLEE